MQRFLNKTVLITGASAGIGAALTKQFADEGANLVLLARRVERLEALATQLRTLTQSVQVHRCDVTQASDIEATINELSAAGLTVDVVVANAGFGVVGSLEHLSAEDYRRQFDTNVFGMLNTIYATLPALKTSQGQLVLMGSLASYASLPGSSAYSMSKFAVRALAESLRPELAAHGISVTLISPGFVDSDIRRTDNLGRLHPHATDKSPAWLRIPTDKAARTIVNAIYRKRREQFVGMHARVIIWIARFAPWILRLIARVGVKARTEPSS